MRNPFRGRVTYPHQFGHRPTVLLICEVCIEPLKCYNLRVSDVFSLFCDPWDDNYQTDYYLGLSFALSPFSLSLFELSHKSWSKSHGPFYWQICVKFYIALLLITDIYYWPNLRLLYFPTPLMIISAYLEKAPSIGAPIPITHAGREIKKHKDLSLQAWCLCSTRLFTLL